MKQHEKIQREPFIRIVKRDSLSLKKKALVYAIALISGLIFSSILCTIFSKGNTPISYFEAMFKGAFATPRKIWVLLRDCALLLGVSLALVPAFKMKFWNLGGNGQVLIGCLSTIACMYYLGGKLPDAVVIIIMIIASILSGAIWALIPAIFKALFNTNESLFTLMMNYIASGLVATFINIWVKGGSGVLYPLKDAHLPTLVNEYLLTIVVFLILCIAIYIYLKYSKQGYEIAVVGESQNTAKYIGIDVKKVIIRTLILSGAICGLVGLFIGGAINYTVNTSSANNMGFTGIMTAWLANFNPLLMLLSCLFITFISKGMVQVRKDFKFTNDAISNFIVGIIYFFIIACAFFINYQVVFNFKNKKREEISE